MKAASASTIADRLADALDCLSSFLTSHGIWHTLAFGTLLGAIRANDIIPWDHDLDLLIRPADVPRLLALNPLAQSTGLHFTSIGMSASALALNPSGITAATGWRVVATYRGIAADLYPYSLFSDGVLRWYDVQFETYWNPEVSFPHWFVDELEHAVIRGRSYPAPRAAERWLEGIYGDEWREPFRQGDRAGSERSEWGYRFGPKVHAETRWCEEQGWNRNAYSGELRWPRRVAAAGPMGYPPEGGDPTRVRWWRSLHEVVTLC